MTTRPLSADDLADLATANPRSSAGRAQLRFAAASRLDHAESSLRQSIGAKLATTPAEVPARHQPNLTANNHDPATARSRDLTPAETAWIAALPTNPAAVSLDDAQRLVNLAREARTEIDRHVVRERLDPLRDLHRQRGAVAEAERELALAGVFDPRAASAPGTDWPAWRRAIADRLAVEVPELTEAETYARADRLVADRVEEAKHRQDLARRRLADVLRDHGARSQHHPYAHTWPGRGA